MKRGTLFIVILLAINLILPRMPAGKIPGNRRALAVSQILMVGGWKSSTDS